MRKARFTTRLLTAALATGLMLTTTAVLAQSVAGQRSEERKANRSGNKADAKQEDRYPDATRKAPDARASSKMASKVSKLFDSYNSGSLEKTRPLADEIIADERANAYDKAISARIAGAMLIGEDDAAAADYLQRAVQFDGLSNNDHFESMFIIAQLQAQEDNYAAAGETLDRMLTESQSKDPNHQALKANILLRQEKYPEAIAVLKPLVDSAEDPNPQWMQLLMAAYAESDQGAEAAKLAEQIASKSPGDKRSQINLAAAYLQTDQYDKAAAVYEKLRAAGELTEDRDYRNLMSLYINMDNGGQKAIEVINEGLQKGILKEDHTTYLALAQAHYFSEPSQIEPAIAAYRKAAPLDDDGATYLNLARVLANEGRLAEAKQAAQQALDKGLPKPEEARSILARTN